MFLGNISLILGSFFPMMLSVLVVVPCYVVMVFRSVSCWWRSDSQSTRSSSRESLTTLKVISELYWSRLDSDGSLMTTCPCDCIQAMRQRRRHSTRPWSSWRIWSAQWTRRFRSWFGPGGCRRFRPVWTHVLKQRSEEEVCSEEESCSGGNSSMRERFSGRFRAPEWKVHLNDTASRANSPKPTTVFCV